MGRLTKRALSGLASPTTAPSEQPSVSPSSPLPLFLTNPDLPLPKLVVFDLDYTLWPFWVDTHVTPPVKPAADHQSVTDKYMESYAFYEDVPEILQALPLAGVKLAVASRTCAPALGRQLLKCLQLRELTLADGRDDDGDEGGEETQAGKTGRSRVKGVAKARKGMDAFDAGMEIYPSSKIRHFEAIHKRTGIPYQEMLFFDDEARNRDTESLGVTMWLVRDGVSWKEVERGVGEWRKRRGHGR